METVCKYGYVCVNPLHRLLHIFTHTLTLTVDQMLTIQVHGPYGPVQESLHVRY